MDSEGTSAAVAGPGPISNGFENPPPRDPPAENAIDA